MLEKLIQVSLTTSEKAVSRFIVSNLKDSYYYTVRELAKQAHVSPSTIVRFSKKCGFDSYHELRHYLKQEVENQGYLSSSNQPRLHDLFMNQIFPENIQERIEKVGSIFEKSAIIYCVGMGSSGIVAEYAARKFSTIGYKSFHSNEPYAPFFMNQLKNKSVVLVIFSVSGETRELIEVMNILQPTEVPIISITNSHLNQIAKISDYNLPYYIENERLSLNFDLSSQLPSIAIVEYLAGYCYSQYQNK